MVLGPSPAHDELKAVVPRREFSRVSSAPSSYYAPPPKRVFGRTATTVLGSKTKYSDAVEKIEAAIELYLGGNMITSIPRELFSLRGLTVLSLRKPCVPVQDLDRILNTSAGSNKLDYLPPCIGNLTSLKELNVANNKLRYLPSEIVGLNLTSLLVHPNPFIPPPASRPTDIQGLFAKRPVVVDTGRVLSPLVRHEWAAGPDGTMRVLPLSELAYRVLLAPRSRPSQNPLSSLAEHGHSSMDREQGVGVSNWHDFDRDEWADYNIPLSVWNVLETAAPISSPSTRSEDEQRDVFNAQVPAVSGASHVSRKGTCKTDSDEYSALMQAATYYPHFCPSPSHEPRQQLQQTIPSSNIVSAGRVPKPFPSQEIPSSPSSRAAPIPSDRLKSFLSCRRGAPFDGMGIRERERAARPRTPPPSSSSRPGLDNLRSARIPDLHRVTQFGSTNTSTIPSGLTTRHTYPYLRHVEERYEWVGEIAGVTIAETRVGRVPILWRGCQVGCLAFLGGDAAAGADEDHLAYGVPGAAPLDGEAGFDGFDIDEVEKLSPADEAPELACSDSEDSLDLEVKAAL